MDVIGIVNLLCEVNFSRSCLYQNHIEGFLKIREFELL